MCFFQIQVVIKNLFIFNAVTQCSEEHIWVNEKEIGGSFSLNLFLEMTTFPNVHSDWWYILVV